MITTELDNLLRSKIVQRGGATLYFLMDAASDSCLPGKLWQCEDQPHYKPLLAESMTHEVVNEAPYLVSLSMESPFYQWLLETLSETPIGYFMVSKRDLLTLSEALKGFNRVRLANGETPLFRYFDPRVICSFLKIGNAEQLQDFSSHFDAIAGVDYRESKIFSYDNSSSNMTHSNAQKKCVSLSFTESQQQQFVERTLPFQIDHYMVTHYPEIKEQALTDRLSRWESSISTANKYGCNNVDEIGLFVSLGYIIDVDFHLHPDIHKQLAQDEPLTFGEKVAKISHRLWEEAKHSTGSHRDV